MSGKMQKAMLGQSASRRVAFSAVAGLGFAALVAGGTVAFASEIHFSAELRGRGEAPPNDSPAVGHVDATLDTDTRTLTWRVTLFRPDRGPDRRAFPWPDRL